MARISSAVAEKQHVLICDDDAEFAAELSEALAARGFAATAFLSMSAIRTAILTPTILILDICMPEPDGIEILNLLARHEQKNAFKIVLVSGGNVKILGMAAALCHFHGLNLLGTLQKPLAVRALCELLDTDEDF